MKKLFSVLALVAAFGVVGCDKGTPTSPAMGGSGSGMKPTPVADKPVADKPVADKKVGDK